MGLVPLSLKTLQNHIHHVGGFANCTMMELGDQQMYCHPNVPEGSAVKSFMEQLGVRHTSVDVNGQLGSIPVNLAEIIDKPEWMGAFDVVTDFGTSEHVGKLLEDLYNCRSNCHHWARPGGILIFMNPKTGHWPGHGYHCFTMAHYEKLCATKLYRGLEISEHPTLGNFTDGYQVHAVLQRLTHAPFVTYEEFSVICEGTVFPV